MSTVSASSPRARRLTNSPRDLLSTFSFHPDHERIIHGRLKPGTSHSRLKPKPLEPIAKTNSRDRGPSTQILDNEASNLEASLRHPGPFNCLLAVALQKHINRRKALQLPILPPTAFVFFSLSLDSHFCCFSTYSTRSNSVIAPRLGSCAEHLSYHLPVVA